MQILAETFENTVTLFLYFFKSAYLITVLGAHFADLVHWKIHMRKS